MYLKYLRDIVSKQISAKIEGEAPLEESTYEYVVKILKEYKHRRHFKKQFFCKMSASSLEKINEVCTIMIFL